MTDNVKLLTFTEVVAGAKPVVPKSSLLNQLPVVRVWTAPVLIKVKLGALVDDPPVVPNTNVLV